MGFMAHKVALGQVLFSEFFSFSFSFPPLLHIHSCIIWGLEKRSFAAAVPQ
jgi:hypothetical protein